MRDLEKVIAISSSQNEKLKRACRLTSRRERKKTDLFTIEGYRELLCASESSYHILDVFFCSSLFLKNNEVKLLSVLQKKGANLFELDEKLFRKLSYRDRPDGLIAIAEQRHLSLKNVALSKHPFLLIAESIEKPGNLGTILRSSDAAGVDAVIVTDPQTDIHNPNVVRASIGTLFSQQVIEASNAETLAFLTEKDVRIVAASPHAKEEFTEVDLKGNLAVLVGSEQYGLSEEWFKNAKQLVKIPMYGRADSLNVAQATTLMLYEILRQRNAP